MFSISSFHIPPATILLLVSIFQIVIVNEIPINQKYGFISKRNEVFISEGSK